MCGRYTLRTPWQRLALLALAIGLVVLAAWMFVLWQRPSRITEENFERIQPGMSRAEVEAILGPPGDYRTGRGESKMSESVMPPIWHPDRDPFDRALTITTWREMGRSEQHGTWIGDSLSIDVIVAEAEHVQERYACTRRVTQGPFDNLLWRAKRQWRRWFPEK
jgi:hypothetical protein